MTRRRAPRKKGRRAAALPAGLPTANIDRIRLRLQGWFLRTLRMDTAGEYGKLKRLLELFLLQCASHLDTHLWDRSTEVAMEEALQHLALRWGPKFRRPLEVEIRVTDTHLKFSLTAPQEAGESSARSLTSKQRQRREAAAERSLYLVRRLANRLHVGPAGRQLVFWRLVHRDWDLRLKRRGRVG